jgi:excisionase family DNA binding protein
VRRRPSISDREHQRRASQRAWSIRDFCKRYDVGRTTVHQEIKEGRLKARKAGRRTLIGDDDAEEWWRSLPAIKEATDEATLESLDPDASAPLPLIIERNPSIPIAEIATTPTREGRPSASKSQVGPTTTRHAAPTRKGRV